MALEELRRANKEAPRVGGRRSASYKKPFCEDARYSLMQRVLAEFEHVRAGMPGHMLTCECAVCVESRSTRDGLSEDR